MPNEIMVLDWKERERDACQIVKLLFLFPITTPAVYGSGVSPIPTPASELPGYAANTEAQGGVTDVQKAALDAGQAMFITKPLRFRPYKTAFFEFEAGFDKEGKQLYRRFEYYVDANGDRLYKVNTPEDEVDQAQAALRVPMSNAVMREQAETVYTNEMAVALAKYSRTYADISKIGLTLDAPGGA